MAGEKYIPQSLWSLRPSPPWAPFLPQLLSPPSLLIHCSAARCSSAYSGDLLSFCASTAFLQQPRANLHTIGCQPISPCFLGFPIRGGFLVRYTRNYRVSLASFSMQAIQFPSPVTFTVSIFLVQSNQLVVMKYECSIPSGGWAINDILPQGRVQGVKISTLF